jgi:hypothetical protein
MRREPKVLLHKNSFNNEFFVRTAQSYAKAALEKMALIAFHSTTKTPFILPWPLPQ